MSRQSKLASGVLLLILAAVLGLLGMQAPVNPNAVSPVTFAIAFAVPGFLLLLFGILPPKGRRARMEFVPSRLYTGLGITAAGVLTLFLFYQVIHVMPQFILIGAMLAVPVGLLYAATCWSEVGAEQSGVDRTNSRSR